MRAGDSRKIIAKKAKWGKGVFALRKIKKGERIAAFDGPIYASDYPRWTQDLADHCIQFAPDMWRDSLGAARLVNHSCEPNCGIKDRFVITALRDIRAGEEITWDYEMTERHPVWRMRCRCGTKSCRKSIGNFENMPEAVRKKYRGFISAWLVPQPKIAQKER